MTTTTMTTPEILLTEGGNYILCQDCDKEFATCEFVGSDDKVFKLCAQCEEEAHEVVREQREAEEEEDRRKQEEEDEYRDDLEQCESCQTEKAVIVFMHLTNGNFELCQKCFGWADHEDDYGQDFKKEKSLMEKMTDFLRG